jgi:putative addiction module antidote
MLESVRVNKMEVAVMLQAKVTTVGNSVGIVLPKEALLKLRLKKGDMLYFCETSDGYVISPYDADFSNQMAVAEKVMHDERDVLKALADS